MNKWNYIKLTVMQSLKDLTSTANQKMQAFSFSFSFFWGGWVGGWIHSPCSQTHCNFFLSNSKTNLKVKILNFVCFITNLHCWISHQHLYRRQWWWWHLDQVPDFQAHFQGSALVGWYPWSRAAHRSCLSAWWWGSPLSAGWQDQSSGRDPAHHLISEQSLETDPQS